MPTGLQSMPLHMMDESDKVTDQYAQLRLVSGLPGRQARYFMRVWYVGQYGLLRCFRLCLVLAQPGEWGWRGLQAQI